MRSVSRKKAAELRIYMKMRAAFLTDRLCEFPGQSSYCGELATEVHHRRGRVGALLLDERHWSGLCHDHHVWVTEHPAESYASGISERRVGAV